MRRWLVGTAKGMREMSGRFGIRTRTLLRSEAQDVSERQLNVFLVNSLCRLFAVAMFAVGIQYWIALIGVEPQERFDLMPIWWQTVAPALAVLYPVAGIGLWLLAGWGPAVWILLVLVEAVMHLGFPDLFGSSLLWLALQVWGLVMLATFRWIGHRERYAEDTRRD